MKTDYVKLRISNADPMDWHHPDVGITHFFMKKNMLADILELNDSLFFVIDNYNANPCDFINDGEQ